MLRTSRSTDRHDVVHRRRARPFRRGDLHLELGFVDVGRDELLPDDAVERVRGADHQHGDDDDHGPVAERPAERARIAGVETAVEAGARIRVSPVDCSRRNRRALIIGVSVNDTSSETRMATAAVKPNWYRNRPEMLDMNDTGMKITTRQSVVASTGSAISAVASRAASNGESFFSSTNRKMFSSTTIASSMTMPTISTSASMVTLLSVKSSAAIMPKVVMTEEGMATAAMTVDRQLRMKAKTTRQARMLPRTRCLLISCSAASMYRDWSRMTSSRTPGGKFRLGARHVGLDRIDDFDGVGADLTPDLEDDRGDAVQPGEAALLFGAVLGAADVADPNRRAVHGADDEIVEVLRIGDAAGGAQHLLARTGGDVAARRVLILALERMLDFADRQLVRGEPVRIDPDVDGPLETAGDRDLAHAGGAFDPRLDDLVRDLGQLPHREVSGQRDGHRRGRVGVGLGDVRIERLVGELAHDRSDPIAHVLRGDVDVAIEAEDGEDVGVPGAGHRSQLGDAFHRVHRLFHRLGDLRLGLLDRGAWQGGADGDLGQIDAREAVDAEAEIAGGADDDQREDDHRGEDRAGDADGGERLHSAGLA